MQQVSTARDPPTCRSSSSFAKPFCRCSQYSCSSMLASVAKGPPDASSLLAGVCLKVAAGVAKVPISITCLPRHAGLCNQEGPGPPCQGHTRHSSCHMQS